jgi:hypothetical protein
MYDDKSLDSIASLEHIIVEAKDKNDAEEIAEEKIYRLPKQDFDSLNIISAEEVKEEKYDLVK